jgi:hypothetical protein
MSRRSRLLAVLLLACFSFGLTLTAAQRDAQPHRQVPQPSNTIGIERTLHAYFNTRYEALRLQVQQPLRELIADSDAGRQLLARESARQALRMASFPASGRTVTSYHFDIDVRTVSLSYSGDMATATVLENGTVVTDLTGAEDEAREIEHQILLVRTETGWRVASDDYADEYLPSIVAHGNSAVEMLADMRALTRDNELERDEFISRAGVSAKDTVEIVTALRAAGFSDSEIETNVLREKTERLNHASQEAGEERRKGGSISTLAGTARTYNRTAAVSYAHQWAYSRNSAYPDFTNLGGDCTNFISQILRAGGAPMDNAGSYQWYYTSMTSRSPSWSGVEQLYSYLVGNTYTGPYARSGSLTELRPGDIVQLKTLPDRYGHSTVVVSADWLWSWSKLNYVYVVKLAMHDTNRDNYPLDNYSQYQKRFAVVRGYYD